MGNGRSFVSRPLVAWLVIISSAGHLQARGNPGLYLDDFYRPINVPGFTWTQVKDRLGWWSLGVRRARLGGSAVFVDGACEDGENSPARDEAPTTIRVSCVAGLRVPSPTTRIPGHTFSESGLPDCQSGHMQVYIKCHSRPV